MDAVTVYDILSCLEDFHSQIKLGSGKNPLNLEKSEIHWENFTLSKDGLKYLKREY